MQVAQTLTPDRSHYPWSLLLALLRRSDYESRRSNHWSLADLLAMARTATVDLNQVLASRRTPAGHRCESSRSEPPASSRAAASIGGFGTAPEGRRNPSFLLNDRDNKAAGCDGCTSSVRLYALVLSSVIGSSVALGRGLHRYAPAIVPRNAEVGAANRPHANDRGVGGDRRPNRRGGGPVRFGRRCKNGFEASREVRSVRLSEQPGRYELMKKMAAALVNEGANDRAEAGDAMGTRPLSRPRQPVAGPRQETLNKDKGGKL